MNEMDVVIGFCTIDLSILSQDVRLRCIVNLEGLAACQNRER